MSAMKVGLIGAGNISDEYLVSLGSYADIEVVAIADLDLDRARSQADKYGIAIACGAEELLALPEIELVVNLTIPAVHGEVALAAVRAGKHVWGEKPITLDRESARELLEAAAAAGVVVGNAPDTVLGRGIQNSFKLINGGLIGEVQTVLTLMQGPGPDGWHPRPQFLFAKGAGPLFDIGPYYFTTLAMLFGEIESVYALGHRASIERTVRTGPDAGQTFPVEIYTHISVLTTFSSGVVGTSIYSFDSPVKRQLFEVTGSKGTVTVPVSGFDGASNFLPAGANQDAWQALEPQGANRARGVGVLEMARAIRAGVPPRASGELAYHVLDAMLAVEESIELGAPVAVTSRLAESAPLAPDWDPEAGTFE